MEPNRKSCRLCLSEADFNVFLHGDYCRRTNMIEKIQFCLKITIEEGPFDTICYKCANSVESYYDFAMAINKSQSRHPLERQRERSPTNINRRLYPTEPDPDYSFSFLEVKQENKRQTSPFSYPYFSPPNVLVKQSCELKLAWDKPKPQEGDRHKKSNECERRQHSIDLFESLSQSEDEPNLDWKMPPSDNLMKRIKDKCFGRSDFN